MIQMKFMQNDGSIVWYRKASAKKMDGRGRVFKGIMLHSGAKLFLLPF